MTPVGMKSTKRRDWAAAWKKIEDEDGCCRVCGTLGVDPAHLWARGQGGDEHPDNIVPLCRVHHGEFDSGDLDIAPFLTPQEKAKVVELADIPGREGIEAARRRLRPSAYPSKVAT